MRALIRQLEEAKKDSGFATRKDLEALGYDNDAFKTGVPALVKKTLGPGLTAVERGLAQGGIFTFRDSFFYKGNRSADDLGNRIVSELAKEGYAAKVLATGENDSAAFVGGADPWSAKSSFFWVVLQVKSKQQSGASAQEEAAGPNPRNAYSKQALSQEQIQSYLELMKKIIDALPTDSDVEKLKDIKKFVDDNMVGLKLDNARIRVSAIGGMQTLSSLLGNVIWGASRGREAAKDYIDALSKSK
jgi:hypothetical protein